MRGTHQQPKPQHRHLILWLILAVVALGIFALELAEHDRSTLLRWSVFLSTDLEQGRAVFHEKGCIRCHSVNGMGGKIGPDLGGQGGEPPGLAFLVTAMWNHAPRMWAYMRAEHFSYPTLTYEQAAQLVAYLYMVRRMDPAGNAQRGRMLFRANGCSRCHSTIEAPSAWAQAMWNHAPAMEQAMSKAGLPWPKLHASDLNDLFAYVCQDVRDPVVSQQFPGDPEKGWDVFQSNGCINCHAPQGTNPSSPQKWPAVTFMQVGQLMWNAAPDMQHAMQKRGMAMPQLTGQEMTDLAAFVFASRYFDPPGSAIVGRSVFQWRGCSRCHGQEAGGSKVAPALRGEGRNYNSISLATALWSHGHKMFQRSQQLGFGWPTLQASDLGDLLAFLNSPKEQPPQHDKTSRYLHRLIFWR